MNKKMDLELAIKSLRKEAHKRVLKNEVMKFRLEEDNLNRLLKLAKKLNRPAGTLVREWVTEKLDELDNGRKDTPEIKAITIITDSLSKQGLLQNSQVNRILRLFRQQAI